MKELSILLRNSFIFLFFFTCFVFSSFALGSAKKEKKRLDFSESIPNEIKAEEIALEKEDKKKKNPRLAGILSAVIPISGQIYNGTYVRALSYLALGGIAYYFRNFYNKQFQQFHSAYILRADQDPFTVDAFDSRVPNATFNSREEQRLLDLSDDTRRSRDLLTTGLIVLYIGNIIDAVVYANLYGFNVKDNFIKEGEKPKFTFRTSPTILFADQNSTSFLPGVSIRIIF